MVLTPKQLSFFNLLNITYVTSLSYITMPFLSNKIRRFLWVTEFVIQKWYLGPKKKHKDVWRQRMKDEGRYFNAGIVKPKENWYVMRKLMRKDTFMRTTKRKIGHFCTEPIVHRTKSIISYIWRKISLDTFAIRIVLVCLSKTVFVSAEFSLW